MRKARRERISDIRIMIFEMGIAIIYKKTIFVIYFTLMTQLLKTFYYGKSKKGENKKAS